MKRRSRLAHRTALISCTLALGLAACAIRAPVAPVVELVLPPAPPASSTEAIEAPEREERIAAVAGDLRAVTLRIVHTEKRREDAEQIAKRLTTLGATVRLYPTSDDANESHVGRLYVRSGFEKYAPIIVRAVADLEAEEIVREDGLEGDHNAVLWVVR